MVETTDIVVGDRFESHSNGSYPEITVDGNLIQISSLSLVDENAAEFVLAHEEANREELIRQGLKIGLMVLRDYSTIAKADYVEKEFEGWRSKIEYIINDTFDGDKGALAGQLKQYFGDGGQMKTTLANYFNPALKESVPSMLKDLLEENISSKDSTLQKLLNADDAASPLNKLLESIRKDMRELRTSLASDLAREAGREQEAERGTQKGRDFERQVLEELDGIAAQYGDAADGVGNESGADASKKGDVLVTLNQKNTNGNDVRLVFEVKRRSMSRRELAEELSGSLKNREAAKAVAVFHDVEDIPTKALRGTFRQFNGHYICVANEDIGWLALEVAYGQARIDAMSKHQGATDAIDVDRIQQLLANAQIKLDSLQGVKTRLTQMRKSAEDIRSDLSVFQEEVGDLLRDSIGALTSGTDED